jgi:hypothetical protein
MEETKKVILAVLGSVIASLIGIGIKGLFGGVMGLVIYWLIFGLFVIWMRERNNG